MSRMQEDQRRLNQGKTRMAKKVRDVEEATYKDSRQ
jgi:hypothetical protein